MKRHKFIDFVIEYPQYYLMFIVSNFVETYLYLNFVLTDSISWGYLLYPAIDLLDSRVGLHNPQVRLAE